MGWRLRAATFYEPGDVVIEAVGLPELWEQALQMVCKGGDITLFGGAVRDLCRGGHRALALLADHHTGHLPPHPYTVQEAEGLLKSGRVDPEPFISGVRPLEDVVEALESHGRQEGTKYEIRP
jgi:L-iditol 2-dehydrogenase